MAAGAGSKHQALKQALRLFSPRGADREGLPIRPTRTADEEELEEADVLWDCNLQPMQQLPVLTSRPRRAAGSKMSDRAPSSASTSSVPVNIPDWSKILLHEHKTGDSNSTTTTTTTAGYDDDWVDNEDDDAVRLPPHEMMMRRRRATSLSVVEGVGRTLKGRDMRRVRNSIWAQTGFQD